MGQTQPDGPSADERVELHGRRFILRFTPHLALRKIEVEILVDEDGRKRAFVRVPVRGRTREEARARALEVLQNHAGLDRYLRLVRRVVADTTPGAGIDVEEDAAEVRVRLTGPWTLEFPLALVREDALDPGRTDQELLEFIGAHLRAYRQAVAPGRRMTDAGQR